MLSGWLKFQRSLNRFFHSLSSLFITLSDYQKLFQVVEHLLFHLRAELKDFNNQKLHQLFAAHTLRNKSQA